MIDRRTGIGASEVYDVVEGDRLKVWRSKVEGYQEPDSPILKRGRRLEETVLRMYSDSLEPWKLWIPIPQLTIQHPTSAVLFATPDAFRGDEGWEPDDQKFSPPIAAATVDAKTTATWRGFGEEGTAQVPNKILFQGLTQMACTGLGECDIVALMPSHELRVYKILRDRETEGMLIEKVEQFWKDYVVTKKPPLEFIDDSDGWMEWLNKRYPQETKNHLLAEPGSDLDLQMQALQMLQEKKKLLQAQEDTTKNILRHLLGEHAGVTGPAGRIDYKKTKDGSKTDWKKAFELAIETFDFGKKQVLQEIARTCTTEKPGVRSLHPYWKGSREE